MKTNRKKKRKKKRENLNKKNLLMVVFRFIVIAQKMPLSLKLRMDTR